MNLNMLGVATTFSLTLLALTAPAAANARASAAATGGLPFEVKPVGTFKSPWAMAFLPNGNVLVTQPDEWHRLSTNPKGLVMYWLFFRLEPKHRPVLHLPPAESDALCQIPMSEPHQDLA